MHGKRVIGSLGIALSFALVVGNASPSFAYKRPGNHELISVSLTSPAGSTGSVLEIGSTSINADGRFIAFESLDNTHVAGDVNPGTDIFVRDRSSSTTELINVSSDGLQGINDPLDATPFGSPMISHSGRYVAFASSAPNLVPGDTNQALDVFLRDRKKGLTTLVSVSSTSGASSETSANGDSWFPSVSADGRYVAFASDASNLMDGDANGARDVYLRDLKIQKTVRISIGHDGSEAPGAWPSDCPSIDPKGRYVTFESFARNLVPGDDNGNGDVFLHDRMNGKTEIVSLSSDGSASKSRGLAYSASTCGGAGHSMSSDGRYVVFWSTVTDYIPNDSPSWSDIFVRDRQTGRTERVNVSSFGEEANNQTNYASISPDGRYVVFASSASNLSSEDPSVSPAGMLPMDPIGNNDVFVHDRELGITQLVSLSEGGDPAFDPGGSAPSTCQNNSIQGNSVSSGGRFVSYQSCYGYVADDVNQLWDTYVLDRGPDLGVGDFKGGHSDNEPPEDDRVCLTPDICIPRGAAVSTQDSYDASSTLESADLTSAKIAHRPGLEDLLVVEELEKMPRSPGASASILFGLRFQTANGRTYEARATSLLGGTFGLFDCTDRVAACIHVADLRGGYGTTGERVAFSLPLAELGLQEGGDLSHVRAFTAVGSYLTGAITILDSLRLK